jgi:DnaK suppressor protein
MKSSDHNANYRQALLDKRQQVKALLAGVKFDAIARLGRMADDEQAQISQDEFVSVCLNSLDYEQLQLVNEALDRLDSGHYSICLACDEPISAKRLAAVSWARYCVTCQDAVGAEMATGYPRAGTAESARYAAGLARSANDIAT